MKCPLIQIVIPLHVGEDELGQKIKARLDRECENADVPLSHRFDVQIRQVDQRRSQSIWKNMMFFASTPAKEIQAIYDASRGEGWNFHQGNPSELLRI